MIKIKIKLLYNSSVQVIVSNKINHKSYFLIQQSPNISISKPELKNVFIASSGEQTIGSPLILNEVFNKIGNPDIFSNSSRIL